MILAQTLEQHGVWMEKSFKSGFSRVLHRSYTGMSDTSRGIPVDQF
jgi:hypothetical protein